MTSDDTQVLDMAFAVAMKVHITGVLDCNNCGMQKIIFDNNVQLFEIGLT